MNFIKIYDDMIKYYDGEQELKEKLEKELQRDLR